jgi:hypothetical protein
MVPTPVWPNIRCKEFLDASRWYCVGPPPAFGGRRPPAEAAASPQGWPPPKLLSIQKVFIANGISLMGWRGERFYFSRWVFTAAALPTTLKTGSRLAGRAIEVQKNFEGL